MKKKKEKKEKVFFPYLPSNRIEDNKRTKHIIDILEKNPFVFHKKKNIFNNISKNESKEINIKDNINNDKDVLNFQRVHEENRNIFNDLIEQKSKKIEINVQNYLNFIAEKNKSDILKKNNQNLPLLNSHPKYRNLKK